MIKHCILWPLMRVWISGGITEHLFLDRNQYVNVINHLVLINAAQQLTIDCIGWSQTPQGVHYDTFQRPDLTCTIP